MKIINVVGGLGSQMMAYSLYLALLKKGIKVICDFSNYDKWKQHNGPELSKVFQIKEEKINHYLSKILYEKGFTARSIRFILKKAGIIKIKTASKKRFNFDEDVFNIKGNVIYDQCWTSYKYFDDIRDEIINTFKFNPITDKKNLLIQSKIQATNSVAIHVRRGDYTASGPLKNLAPIEYYSKAINYIKERHTDLTFYIFSNDISWCKDNLVIDSALYVDWNAGESSYIDMQLMSMCDHIIIPNSSFSWWSAYLNKNCKTVIAPERWCNPGYGIDMKDMNHPSWLVIKNYNE